MAKTAICIIIIIAILAFSSARPYGGCQTSQELAKNMDSRCMRSFTRRVGGKCSGIRELFFLMGFMQKKARVSRETSDDWDLEDNSYYEQTSPSTICIDSSIFFEMITKRCERSFKRRLVGICETIKELGIKLEW